VVSRSHIMVHHSRWDSPVITSAELSSLIAVILMASTMDLSPETLQTHSHVPCRAPAVLRPCRFASNFSRKRHSTAGARHGMCELTSAVSQRPVGDLPRFGFCRLPRGVSRLVVWFFPFTRGLSRSGRHYRGTAGAQHGMCELARHGRDTVWYV
jgi:hypothetical protein